MRSAWIAFLAAALVCSCSNGPGANSVNGRSTGPTASNSRIPRNRGNSAIGLVKTFEGTLGATEMKNPKAKGSITLVNLFVARYGNYDGVMFEFAGPEVPSYRVEYVDAPVRACGSEEVVPVGGKAWMLIKFTGAKAHTEAGEPMIDDVTLPRDVAVLRDFKVVCDTEGRLELVFGISGRNKYQVTKLSEYRVKERDDQTGIMVEIKHPE